MYAIRSYYVIITLSLVSCSAPQLDQPIIPDATITSTPEPLIFNGQKAYDLAKIQVDYGPRVPGSEAHENTVNLILDKLNALNWTTDIQQDQYNDYEIKNIIGKRETSKDAPWIIIARNNFV